ncbi:MAG: hypothetical protein ACOCXJ_01150 [Planctomycetota bacterium]
MKWSTCLHVGIALVWAGALVAGGIGLTMLGSEEHRIAKRRGLIEREMDGIDRSAQQIGTALEVASSRSRIELAVRRLELPVRAPVEVASR